uniref:Uncharacterized protein n=1 Tax=Arundo donax TaxID=35708 RepID=A0A0A9C1B1_ARUDO
MITTREARITRKRNIWLSGRRSRRRPPPESTGPLRQRRHLTPPHRTPTPSC